MKRTVQMHRGNLPGSRSGKVPFGDIPRNLPQPRRIRRLARLFKTHPLSQDWAKWIVMPELTRRLLMRGGVYSSTQ